MLFNKAKVRANFILQYPQYAVARDFFTPKKIKLKAKLRRKRKKKKLTREEVKIRFMNRQKHMVAYRLRHPDRYTARKRVYSALRNKTLTKMPCFCGELKVEAHHEDYSKPLIVIWLCHPHHKLADKEKIERESNLTPA